MKELTTTFSIELESSTYVAFLKSCERAGKNPNEVMKEIIISFPAYTLAEITPDKYCKEIGIEFQSTALLSHIQGAMRQVNLAHILEGYFMAKKTQCDKFEADIAATKSYLETGRNSHD